MFKQISNSTLRQKYFVNAAVSQSGNISRFEWLCKLTRVVCKDNGNDDDLKLNFLFNLFSDNCSTMKRKSLKDFCDVFKISIDEFPDKAD